MKTFKQTIPQLSPLNYIKTKARTLPIYKCYVNENWKENGMANVVVIRQHINGKFTFGGYLVDIFALGTKNTFFNINQPQSVIDDLLSRQKFIEIEYNLAHNIIFGGNNYAKEHNFKIHKDFEAVSKYILELNDEKIPYIEVEFGKNGKPVLFQF